jgi:hypothetical protein
MRAMLCAALVFTTQLAGAPWRAGLSGLIADERQEAAPDALISAVSDETGLRRVASPGGDTAANAIELRAAVARLAARARSLEAH